MIPIADTHCHLLAGLDDGPRTLDDAVRMCQMAWSEGTRTIAATAHLCGQWPQATPDRIRSATAQLVARLRRLDLPLTVHPSAEIRLRPDLAELWTRGELLTVADRGTYLLLELPAHAFVDVRHVVRDLGEQGIRPILAHPERHPEFLHEPGTIQELIHLGCLVQITSTAVTDPPSREDSRALKRWVREGIVHLVASDGHSPRSRPPQMASAYRRISDWAGASTADRLLGINGLAVLEGLPLRVPMPAPPQKRWFSRVLR